MSCTITINERTHKRTKSEGSNKRQTLLISKVVLWDMETMVLWRARIGTRYLSLEFMET